jgi:parallel beta-helix repeat protein
MKHVFPLYIAILTAILLLAAPALANNITDYRELVAGQVSPGTGINGSIGGQGKAILTAPVPRIETIAGNNSGIPGVAPQVQAQKSSQPLLAGDINTVTNLNELNVSGSPGYEYWDIVSPGTYILSADISTSNNYAVRIFASNVIFDGNGKTITGPGIGNVEPGDSYYGIRVNWGQYPEVPSQNVTVKNVNVTNKFFGVIYEHVHGGGIRDSHFASNGTGIYTWKSSYLTIQSNTVNSNNNDGIVLDAHESTNDYFTIDSNNVYANGMQGIILWLSNNHNTITNNQVNDNNMGIVLTDGGSGVGGTDNTLSYNTVNGNVNGIFVSNYHGNRMIDNSLSGNSNVAVWILQASSNNHFTRNYVQDSGWVGMSLTGSSNGNFFYNNNFRNTDNEYSDGTVFNNQWYITPTPGVNIVGGLSIGGNYWSNPSSTGFSDTQPDSNNDGFCDQAYYPQSDLIDNYPLHKTAVTGKTPSGMPWLMLLLEN